MSARPGRRDGIDESRYKWIILAAAFLAQMSAVCSTSFGFGVLVKPIAAEFNLKRGAVNIGLMLLIAGMALFSPLIGRALDRWPMRWTMLAGALAFAIGSLVIATTDNLWLMMAAIFLPLAGGTAALGPVTASTLVARWFDERRGRALGIVAISASAGGMLLVPLLSLLVDSYSWRSAILIGGTVISVVGAFLRLFVVRDRRRSSPAPLAKATALATPPSDRWSVGALLKTRDFLMIVISIGMMLSMSQALLGSLVAYGTDRGFSTPLATALIAAVSFSSILGKIMIGWLSDTADKRWLLAGVAVMLVVFLLILLANPSLPILIIGCLVAGMTVGGTLPLWGALVFSRFGIASFGLTMGLTVPMQLPLQLLALRFIGESYDRTGSYALAFTVFAGLAPVAMVTALLIGRPGFRRL